MSGASDDGKDGNLSIITLSISHMKVVYKVLENSEALTVNWNLGNSAVRGKKSQ
jgi:hypothetical protein